MAKKSNVKRSKHSNQKAHKLPGKAPVTIKTVPVAAATVSRASAEHKITADQYNDPTHNYLHYWEGRDYENQAEIIAIKRLLMGKRFKHAVDIGGGYGRLCVLLAEYADKVTLAEPSQQQLDIAKD